MKRHREMDENEANREIVEHEDANGRRYRRLCSRHAVSEARSEVCIEKK